MKSYDRADGETTKAYAAFCIYRDLGADRSLLRTANNFYPRQSPDNSPTHPNIARIERWSKAWRWVDRCRDFDLDREREVREHTRRRDLEEHDLKLERFRQDNENLGRGLMEIATDLIAAINELTAPARERLNNNQPLEKGDAETILSAPASIRSIALFAQTGSQMNADGLLIRQLIEKFKQGD
jgi:hypothetical protein